MFDFSGKIVLIPGGTGALGSAIVQEFINCNATVITTYLNDKNVNLKSKTDKTIEMIKINVTNEVEVSVAIANLRQKYGRIDIMANVVGGYLGGKSVTEISGNEWNGMMNLNLMSAFLLTKYVIPAIKASKHGGKIVHISSMTGLNANGLDSAYAASKAGLIRLVESVSQEVKNDEINVNCILPSIIDTEANRKAMPNEDFSKWVKPHDLANIILFLCSEYGKAITGTAIPTRGFS
jgi:NAD(P)-dependent dehydrogenase (short-subunit alcohol dehydrogenase family)